MRGHRDPIGEGGSDRSFGLVFSVFFLLIGIWPTMFSAPPRTAFLLLALGFFCASLAFPKILRPFNRLWWRFGQILHKVTNPIVMALIFFVVLTPMALVMRAMGRDYLGLRLRPDFDSYWQRREDSGPLSETMKQQY